MEDLFRMVLLRPAVAPDKMHPRIDLTQESKYQNDLRAALGGDDPRKAARDESRAFVRLKRFLGESAENPFADQLELLQELLVRLEHVTPVAVRKTVEKAFGRPTAETAADDKFLDTMSRLRDSIVAIKLLQEEHTRPLEELVGQLRLMELVVRADREATFPTDADELRIARFRTLQFPDGIGLGSVLSTRTATEDLEAKVKVDKEKLEAEIANLLSQHAEVEGVLVDLERLDPSHFAVTEQMKTDSVPGPDHLSPRALAEEQASFRSRMRDLLVTNSGEPVASADEDEELFSVSRFESRGSSSIVEALLDVGAAQIGQGGFTPSAISFTLAPAGVKALSSDSRRALEARGFDLAQIPVDRAAERLRAERAEVVQELERIAGHPVKKAFKRVGDALVEITTPLTTGWGASGTGGLLTVPYVAVDGRIPQTRGEVRSSGVADLLLVRQQLTGYEGADVADIENVLKGERKSREHTRRQETVLTTFAETEVTTDKEQEHEASDRFEMARESSETIKEDIALKAGARVSGKYGPVVEFAVSAEGSYARTKEEATKSATSFAHDVTDRSSLKIAERVLERTTTMTTTEVTEKNLHQLNNTKTGAANVAGVYQWVNKVYQAQMFNYGLRAMFDFLIPEPAAFLIAAMSQAHASLLTVEKPPEFTLLPSQIDEVNYGFWAHEYRATDVSPPPDLFKTASLNFKAGTGDVDTSKTTPVTKQFLPPVFNHSAEVTLEEGYQAAWASVGAVWTDFDVDSGGNVSAVVGQRALFIPNTGENVQSTQLDGELGSVPVALRSFNLTSIAVAVEVKCLRTGRAMEKWRLDTHGKLMTAYQARLSEYEEKLGQLEARAGTTIQGRNPAANRMMIENELKKNCITILTDQHFDLFDAIDDSPANNLPQIDLFEAAGEGPYVRFFEQAFEWEHMSWVTYPYFWGRKDEWDERIAYEDPDPAFNDFLQAGYARVTVPARRGLESAIDHFQTCGELWNGGPLPDISSELYLPIADELAEQLGRPASEVPQGDPWTVRVPTTLVHLRADDKLPEWQQDAQGNWVEVP